MEHEIQINGLTIRAGQRHRFEIPVARLPTETWLSLPVEVVCGAHPGPRLWLSGAVHGDEINGVEIIRQLLEQLDPRTLGGTVVAVPIVNVFGFINQSRYLPDRRDLNRSFPGGRRGSLASRLAHLFMRQVVEPCTHGIDLHTGSNHRTNLPQIRANLNDPATRRCAQSFGAPVMVNAHTRDGSLREAAANLGKAVLVYEAGEPLRFDPDAIRLGVRGVLRVMTALGMRKRSGRYTAPAQPLELCHSRWVRARRSGVARLDVQLGQRIEKRQALGVITDAFGDDPVTITSPFAGLVIGHTNNPLVHQGDAVAHVAMIAGGT